MSTTRWITDWTPSDRYPVYTRANAGEVLPDPASPLGWTMVWEPALVHGWADAQVRCGTIEPDEVDPEHPEVIGTFGGYLYINASMARLFGVRAPGLSPEMVDRVYFGEHPDVPPYVAAPWHERAGNTEKLGQWMASVMSAVDLPELREDRAAANAVRLGRPDLGSLTDEQLVARARGLVPLLRHLFARHLEITAATSIGPAVLDGVAQAMGDVTIALSLITAIGDVDSAGPSHAMWALSRLPAGSVEFVEGFDDLLHEVGSRGPNEWDIRSETWETRPALALALVDAMRTTSDDDSPTVRNAHNVAVREQITVRVREALAAQPETLAMFEAALRSAHLHLAGRERTKTNIIKVLHEVRMAVRELGERHEYTQSQICMLLDDELDAFVAGPSEMRARLAAREQQYRELFRLDPPFIVDGVVAPIDQWPRRGGAPAPPGAPGDVLHGVPGSPGTVVGRARVVLDPADPPALEPGDVLVAPITDPSWTPLFVPASAVVVDVGAPVSHAVIVSRELGIPCVVSVTGATQRIADGAMVRVDGSAGTVTLL